jgi:hypothetical protein
LISGGNMHKDAQFIYDLLLAYINRLGILYISCGQSTYTEYPERPHFQMGILTDFTHREESEIIFNYDFKGKIESLIVQVPIAIEHKYIIRALYELKQKGKLNLEITEQLVRSVLGKKKLSVFEELVEVTND